MNPQEKIQSLGALNPIIEVGCDALLESTPFLRETFPGASIFCFDPDPIHRAAIAKNGQREKLDVQFFPIALSDKVGDIEFWTSTNGLCSSMKKPKCVGMDNDHPVKWHDTPTFVPTCTLDYFCEQNGIKDIGLLWMDVQSGEVMVLAGAKRMLPKIQYIFAEHNTDNIYEGEPGYAGIVAALPGWEVVQCWPYDVLLKNTNYV